MKKTGYTLIGCMLIVPILIFSGSCRQANEGTEAAPAKVSDGDQVTSESPRGKTSEAFNGTIVEKIDADTYTYLRIDTGKKMIWVAAPVFDGLPGEMVSVPPGLPMADFQSKTLNRKFDMIYFVGVIHRQGENVADQQPQGLPKDHPPMGGGAGEQATHPPMGEFSRGSTIEVGSVEKAEGGQTVAEIITDRKNRAGKTVLVRAKVVKFTPNIMGRNWLHVRDGSGDEGSNDLVVTTDAVVKVGQVAVINGILSIDRDFGFGLMYPVIIENAAVTLE